MNDNLTRISAPAPKPEPTESSKTDDVKWLALTLRRGLLVIVRSIEERYEIEDKGKRAA